MTRPQFSMKTMLWLIVVVAEFFASRAWLERRFTMQRRDWADLINGQEKKHEWLLSEYKRLRRREFRE